jgi:hypothetical protein
MNRSSWVDNSVGALLIVGGIFAAPVALVVLLLLLLHHVGLGYSQRDNESVGQVKFVVNSTPVLCSDFTAASVNFGLTQKHGDSGTFTAAHDVQFLVTQEAHVAVLKEAAATGRLVRIISDEVRIDLCRPNDVLRSVELLAREEWR